MFRRSGRGRDDDVASERDIGTRFGIGYQSIDQIY